MLAQAVNLSPLSLCQADPRIHKPIPYPTPMGQSQMNIDLEGLRIRARRFAFGVFP